jgi:rhodanese-related sulfurtransferase
MHQDDAAGAADVAPLEARRLAEAGALLLDVREDDEWHAGHVPGATHLPMGQVGDRLGEIPSDRTVVCVCRVGGRSGSVAGALAGAGFDVRNMAGGMLAWERAGLPVTTDTGEPGRIV